MCVLHLCAHFSASLTTQTNKNIDVTVKIFMISHVQDFAWYPVSASNFCSTTTVLGYVIKIFFSKI
jgi:hypothetical protein